MQVLANGMIYVDGLDLGSMDPHVIEKYVHKHLSWNTVYRADKELERLKIFRAKLNQALLVYFDASFAEGPRLAWEELRAEAELQAKAEEFLATLSNYSSQYQVEFEPRQLLSLIEQWKRVTEKIQRHCACKKKLLRLLRRLISRRIYCGLGWSKRMSPLMHAGRPPHRPPMSSIGRILA